MTARTIRPYAFLALLTLGFALTSALVTAVEAALTPGIGSSSERFVRTLFSTGLSAALPALVLARLYVLPRSPEVLAFVSALLVLALKVISVVIIHQFLLAGPFYVEALFAPQFLKQYVAQAAVAGIVVYLVFMVSRKL